MTINEKYKVKRGLVEKAKTTDLLIHKIPKSLKAQFKGWCARRGVTIKDAIIQLMQDTLDTEYNFTHKKLD